MMMPRRERRQRPLQQAAVPRCTARVRHAGPRRSQVFEEVASGLLVAGITALGGFGAKWAWGRWRTSPGKPALPPPARRTLAPPPLSELETHARILVVDDEDYAHYALLERQFSNLTRWTSIGGDAAKAIDDRFDLVVLDVRGVTDDAGANDGLEALEVLRRYNPWVPVLLFTAFRGAIRGARKDLASQHAQAVEKKVIPYPEFSEQVVRLLQLGFTRGYFVERLGSLGVDGAAELVAAIEAEPDRKVDWRLTTGTEGPFTRHQVDRMFDVARQIVRGSRWTPMT